MKKLEQFKSILKAEMREIVINNKNPTDSGGNNPAGEEFRRIKAKKQEEIIDKFKKLEYNTLVITFC